MLAGNLLLLSSALVLSGLLILLIAILVIDGLSKILTVWRKPPTERVPAVVNALVDFACAALLWYLSRIVGAERQSASSSASISRLQAGGCSWRRPKR